jgi:hypothetical protein
VCAQLDRLADAMRHERTMLGAVLHRLADAGLDPEQITRLSGLPAEQVRALLDPPAAE